MAYDLSYQLVPSVEEAGRQRPATVLTVIRSNTGRTGSIYTKGEFYAHSSYSFLSPRTGDPFFGEKGWKLLTITEPRDRSRTCNIEIADPAGATKILNSLKLHNHWHVFFHIEGICNVMRLIRFLSSYRSWQQFEEVNGYHLDALRRVDLSKPYHDAESRNADRRVYLWKLGVFLVDNNSRMSLSDLRRHLIQNNMQVSHAIGEFDKGKTEVIIRDVEHWLGQEMGLHLEAARWARAFTG